MSVFPPPGRDFYRWLFATAALLTPPVAPAADAAAAPPSVDVGYKVSDHLKVQLGNLTNTRANAAAWFYASRLPGEPAEGIEDYPSIGADLRCGQVNLRLLGAHTVAPGLRSKRTP
jgi:hypothetical protein